MLKNFINAYKREYFKVFSDDFYGHFKRFENALLEPKFHPSTELKNELKKLDIFITNPINIAIIGQFSSGKSTFINALLQSEILPTGATPVTAKLTHIKYGTQPLLKVRYKNGSESINDVASIANFVDQRVFSDDIDELCIYAPCEILKQVNFIDTPGLNSLSNADTEVTKGILDDVCAVIWLSLIDNAARASELENLELLKGKNTICALNQKDKLNKDEIERVLSHANTTFGQNFKTITAISAKQALNAILTHDESLFEISNFKSILNAIKTHFQDESLKQNFVRQKCEILLSQCAAQHDIIACIHEQAEQILREFDSALNANLNQLKAEFMSKIELAFNEIKQIAKQIADEILTSLKSKTMQHYTLKKTLLNTQKWEQDEYSYLSLDSDEIFSKLIYNDVKFSKFLKNYKREISLLQTQLNAKFDEIYTNLEHKFMIYKSEFENIRKSTSIHSDIEFSALRTHTGAVYEMYLRDYELCKNTKIQKLSLFFEKLNLKVVANYENAIKIAVHFLKDKIEAARVSYEKDPLHFALFIPSANESFERVLTSLNLYEFENEMLSQSSFLNKISSEFEREFHEIYDKNLQKISTLKERHKNLKAEILNIKF